MSTWISNVNAKKTSTAAPNFASHAGDERNEPRLQDAFGFSLDCTTPGGGEMFSSLRDGPLAYVVPPIALALASLVALAVQRIFPYAPEYIYLVSVAAAAWIAGRGAGLITAICAPVTLDYFFLPPHHTIGFSPEAWRLMFPLLLFAMGAAWLSSLQVKARIAQSALSQNQERFTRILTGLPDVVWTMNEEGRLVYLSPTVETLTGFSVSELIAADINFIFGQIHRDDIESFRKAVADLFSVGTPFDTEFRFRRKDAKWIWMHNRATATYRNKDVVFADGVISDISRRKMAELELKTQKAFLEAQLDSTMDGILVVNDLKLVTQHNRRFSEIFEIPPELLVNSDDDPVRNHASNLMKDPRAFLARVKYLYDNPMEKSCDELELKDGRILDRYSSPVIDANGKYHGRIWTFRDVTERRRNEDRLRQLSQAVEQSPAAVTITDLAGNITYVNRKFTECTGYSSDEVVGKNPRILNSGHSSPEVYQELWRTIKGGRTWHGEFRNRKKNGELYWESATIGPILNLAGAITGFLALKEDITARKLIESRLSAAKAAADEAHRSLQAKHLALESERQILNALINNVPDFMYVKDTQSKFVVANIQTARSLGASTSKDLVGKTDFDFLPSEMARCFYEDEQELVRTGKPLYNREENARDENGNQIQILTTKVPIRDNQGNITGIAGVGRNITARKQMESALREAEQKFRGIFDNAIVGIFQSTPDGRFLSVNPAMASIFGYESPNEMVALITDIDHQLYVDPAVREEFKNRVAADGGVQNLECEGIRKDGARIWTSLSVRGIVEDHMIVRYEGMCEDITEQKLLREHLLQAQKLESVGQLAAGIAHEINTPTQFITDNMVFLNQASTSMFHLLDQYRKAVRSCGKSASCGMVERLTHVEEECDLEFLLNEVPRAFEQSLDGVRRVVGIVRAMKEFSHPDAAEKVQLDLNKAIESTITIARNEWKYVAEVATDFDASLPLVVCYPGEINQVVLNLLVNAAHAIKGKVKDSELGKITISTRSHGQYAQIAISDTGTGIPSSIRTRIFEPFFTTKEVGKGTGQGLAIAHSVIVKKHRGKIWFDSEVGVGTTFFINLPFQPGSEEGE